MRKVGISLYNSERRHSGKKDVFIIICILTVGLAFFLIPRLIPDNSTDKTVVIYHDGEEIYRTNLSVADDGEFQLDEIPQITFQIKDHQIRILHSDCKDKICEKTGFIDSGYQSIVCLPNCILVNIVEQNTQSIDIVV